MFLCHASATSTSKLLLYEHRKYSRQLGEPSHAKDQLQSIYLWECSDELGTGALFHLRKGMSKACET